MKQKIKSILPNWLFDILKWFAIIALPAISVFYKAVGARWGWPYLEEVTGTLMDLSLLLGALLCISAIHYAGEKAKLPVQDFEKHEE